MGVAPSRPRRNETRSSLRTSRFPSLLALPQPFQLRLHGRRFSLLRLELLLDFIKPHECILDGKKLFIGFESVDAQVAPLGAEAEAQFLADQAAIGSRHHGLVVVSYQQEASERLREVLIQGVEQEILRTLSFR